MGNNSVDNQAKKYIGSKFNKITIIRRSVSRVGSLIISWRDETRRIVSRAFVAVPGRLLPSWRRAPVLPHAVVIA